VDYTLPPEANPQHLPPPPPAGIPQTALVKTWDPKPYQPYPITVVAQLDGRSYREGFRSVGYPGLESTISTPRASSTSRPSISKPPPIST